MYTYNLYNIPQQLYINKINKNEMNNKLIKVSGK